MNGILATYKPHPYKPYHFPKGCNENLQMQYVNSFNRLRLRLRSAQIYKKCTFLDNFKTITQDGNMKTRQMTSFFYLPFPF